ncbi:MAG: hypothetical protein QOG71_2231 [Pyrinomonadaceae bacterium]|nr:hypothetical protein [Pyrinomonadaceae bacterium]
MAQIFISHSAKDDDLKNFFNKGFATSSVTAKYEEIEQLLKGTITTEAIKQDISVSNAIFVLLSPNVETLSHTRDWVGFEVGFAAGVGGSNKDIWVFENIRDVGSLEMVIPSFDHYVVYDTSDVALVYVKRIIESYNDMRVLRNMAAGSGGGAMLAQDKVGGAVVGGIIGLIYSALSTGRPEGIEVTCPNPKCLLKYRIHLPQFMMQYRCAKCNHWWVKPQ